jgi:hypothetical protein
MTEFKPSVLTQSILNALIVRSFNAFATIINTPEINPETDEPEEFIPEYDFGYFENSDIIWSPGLEPEIPTLTINIKIPESDELVYLHWNGKLEEPEVKANIPFNAEENLTFFVLLELMLYNIHHKHSLEKLDSIDISKYITDSNNLQGS